MTFASAIGWTNGLQKNRIFYSIEKEFIYKKFTAYLDDLVIILELSDVMRNSKYLFDDISTFLYTKKIIISILLIVFFFKLLLTENDESRVDKRSNNSGRLHSSSDRDSEGIKLLATIKGPNGTEAPIYSQVIPKHLRLKPAKPSGKPKLIVQPDQEHVEIVLSTDHDQSKVDESGEASMEVMRVADESGIYEEVQLRPKDKNRRRLARPLAVVSGLFNLNRNSNDPTKGKNDVLRRQSTPEPKKDNDRKSWNIFKPKMRKTIHLPSFLHFDQPSNIDRLSLSSGKSLDRYSDWFNLNVTEMKECDAHIQEILQEQRKEKLPIRHSVSNHVLNCHNLSISSEITDKSMINLVGANVNETNGSYDEGLDLIDNNYVSMKPLMANLAKQKKLVDDITNIISGLDKTASSERRSSSEFTSGSLEPFNTDTLSLDSGKPPSPVETKVVVVSNRKFTDMFGQKETKLAEPFRPESPARAAKPFKPKAMRAPKLPVGMKLQNTSLGKRIKKSQSTVIYSLHPNVPQTRPDSKLSKDESTTKSTKISLGSKVPRIQLASPPKTLLNREMPKPRLDPRSPRMSVGPKFPKTQKTSKPSTKLSPEMNEKVLDPRSPRLSLGSKLPRTPLASVPTYYKETFGSSTLKRSKAIRYACDKPRQIIRSASRTIRRKKVDNFFSFQTFADCYSCKHTCDHECSDTVGPCIGTNSAKRSTATTKRQNSYSNLNRSSESASMFKRVRNIFYMSTKRLTGIW